MHNTVLHPNTRTSLEQFLVKQAHALLLSGDLGAGKTHIAHGLTQQLLNTDEPESHPYYLKIAVIDKAVGIEEIRGIHKFLQLRTTGSAEIRRVVYVEAADSMTSEAQNALLKVLEEPPKDTVLLLTATDLKNIKPTVLSRTQRVHITAPLKTDVRAYFTPLGYSSTEIDKAYSISNGQIGLLSAILQDDQEHQLVSQISLAKNLYGMKPFERLILVDGLSKKREELPSLLYACKRICKSALESAAGKGQQAATKSWHRQLDVVLEAEASLQKNANTKLLLTNFFVSI